MKNSQVFHRKRVKISFKCRKRELWRKIENDFTWFFYLTRLLLLLSCCRPLSLWTYEVMMMIGDDKMIIIIQSMYVLLCRLSTVECIVRNIWIITHQYRHISLHPRETDVYLWIISAVLKKMFDFRFSSSWTIRKLPLYYFSLA